MKAIGGMIGNRRTTTEIPDNIPLGPPTYKVKMMATGGKLTKDMKEDKQKPCMATGGQPKVKKARTPAQLEATKRLVEANRKRREKK